MITVNAAQRSWEGFHTVYIVSGVNFGRRRRAIRVVILPFQTRVPAVTEDEIAILAAKHAARRGWKTVVVMPDVIYGEYAEITNWTDMVHAKHARNLCYVGPGRSRWAR